MSTERVARRMATGPSWSSTLASVLGNPLVQYAAAGLLIYYLLKKAVPDLFGSVTKAGGEAVDTLLETAADITGRPASQVPDERRWYDAIRGVYVKGDRALSDLID